ncbi:MAG: LPXTG cell wall anchor domain-containing protein [Actinomycetota bacterium]|nr:LPXTG cell wall anchor domain-containing protein [Actinomycetota bacterium]
MKVRKWARRIGAVAAAATIIGIGTVAGAPTADALTGKAVILDSSVSGGAASIEAQAAIALGLTVEVKTDVEWAAMTGADFATYRLIVIGDPTCDSLSPAAEANAATWGSVVNGNVVLIGTDPVFHQSIGGAALTNSGIGFAAAAEGRTGLYATLSCNYDSAGPNTPVPMLAGIGSFTVQSADCNNNAHIVASHPALTGLTDTDLSNWSCSVHEAFDSWPSDFAVLAMMIPEDPATPTPFTAADGTKGIPYIVARGEGLSASDISLTPPTSTFATGGTATLTAEIKSGGVVQPGVTVTFTAAAGGPNAGATLSGVTDAAGRVSVTYVSNAPGTDTWTATFTRDGIAQVSNVATIVWEGAAIVAATTTTVAPATTTPTTTAPAVAAQLPVTGKSSGPLTAIGGGVVILGVALALFKRPRWSAGT